MFLVWIDSTELRGYISSYFRYFLEIYLESRLLPVSLWTEFQILLHTYTHTHTSLTYFIFFPDMLLRLQKPVYF